MLVIDRPAGTEVEITASNGELIVVTVLRKGKGRLKLGFTAGPQVKIKRGELPDRGEDRGNLKAAG